MVKTLRFFFFVLLAQLFFIQSILAETIIPVSDEIAVETGAEFDRDLQLRAKFISLMLQVGEEIEHEVGDDRNLFANDRVMVSLLEEKMKVYEAFYETSLNLPVDKKAAFKKLFQGIEWKKVLPTLKKAHIGVETFFKRKGFGLGIAILAGMICEYTVPMVLIHLGLAHFIPLSMMTPWSTMYSFVPGAIQKLKVRKMLSETLGGKTQVNAYLKQQENLLKYLHMRDPEDFLFSINETESMNKTIVVQKERWIKSLIQRFGFKEDTLSYVTLKKFLDENSQNDGYVEWIMQNGNIDKELKVGFISAHLMNINDPEIVNKFQLRFSEQILYLKTNPNWEEVWNWTLEMKKVQSLEELIKKVSEAPDNLHPKEVAIVWEHFLLPEYTKEFDLSYSEARRMYDLFEPVKAKLKTSESSVFDERMKNEIFVYIKKITLGKSFKGCQNSSQQIGQFLLNKTH